MNLFLTNLKKIGCFIIFFALFGNSASATVFTAVLSGNFNSAATWGGVIPGTLLTTDVIIIPIGISVNLTNVETFSGTSTLTVNGALTSSASGSGLIMTAGSLMGSGTIRVDSITMGLTSGLTFTGSIATRKLVSLGTNLASTATVTVGKLLTLASGTLSLTAGSLTMGNWSAIAVTGGSLTTGGTGMLNLDSMYSVWYTTASATTGAELSGTGLDSVSVNVPGTVTLSGNLTLNGVLTLAAGTLALNNHNLTLGAMGNISSVGSGNISGTATSGIIINTTGSLTGALNFAAGGNMLNDLTINMGTATGTASLGSNLTLNGTLTLQSGKIMIGNNNLSIAATGMIMNGSAASYVITNGTGTLTQNLVAGGTDSFYIGTPTNFAPITITANSGSASGDVSINVMNGVLSGGNTGSWLSATQSVVNATWFVSSSAASGINYNMMAMWSAGMELNGFDRTHSHISHFTAGAWDSTASSAAGSSGSLYFMTRTGITSLSPFMVADRNAITTYAPNIAAGSNDIILYPNPAANTLHFSSAATIDNVAVYDLLGKNVKSVNGGGDLISIGELPPGTYIIRFTGSNINTVKKFIKE